MTNTVIFEKLINFYESKAYAHEYIFGFEFAGNIYSARVGSDVLPFVMTLDSASRGQGYSLRFKPNKNQKALLMGKGATVLCSVEYFNNEVDNSKYNRGEIFEKLVTESYGQTWTKDNVPYTEAGDIEVDGVAIQIKFNKATFTNEKSMSLMA